VPFREESCRSSCIYSGPLHSHSRDAVSQHPSTRAGAESIQLIYSGRALQALSDLARQFRCHPIFWRESSTRLFPFLLQVYLWKTFFADLSTRHFPFLLEFDLYTAYFVELTHTFFSSGDYSIALSDDSENQMLTFAIFSTL